MGDKETTQELLKEISKVIRKIGENKVDNTFFATVLVDTLIVNDIIMLDALMESLFIVRKQEFKEAMLAFTKENWVNWIVEILEQIGVQQDDAIAVRVDKNGIPHENSESNVCEKHKFLKNFEKYMEQEKKKKK